METRLQNIEHRLAALERNAETKEMSCTANDACPSFCLARDLFPQAQEGDLDIKTAVIRVTGDRHAGKTTFVRDALVPYLENTVYLASMNGESEQRYQVYQQYRSRDFQYKLFYAPDWSTTLSSWLRDYDDGEEFKEGICFVVDEIASSPEDNLLLERLMKDTINVNMPITWILVSQKPLSHDEMNPFSAEKHTKKRTVPTLHIRSLETNNRPNRRVDVQYPGYCRTYRYISNE